MVSAETETRSMRDGILWESKFIGFLLQPTEQKQNSVVQRMMD
jgi:hypothetical protein